MISKRKFYRIAIIGLLLSFALLPTQVVGQGEKSAADRVAFATRIENGMLDAGINVTVTAIGKQKTTLRVEWIGVSKVTAHLLAKQPTVFQSAKAAGFKRLAITDGFDATWYWTIQ